MDRLNVKAVFSKLGIVRVLQMIFSCAAFSLVLYRAGFNSSYGIFCISVWCCCFAKTTLIVIYDLTHLGCCCYTECWLTFTVLFAVLAAITTPSTSVMYSLYYVQRDCSSTDIQMNCSSTDVQVNCFSTDCITRNYQLAASVCAALLSLFCVLEVLLICATYKMLSSNQKLKGLFLKIIQASVASGIFATLAIHNDYNKFPATQWCLVVHIVCFAVTVLLIFMYVTGMKATTHSCFAYFVAVYTLLAILMYMSAAVIWPVFCFAAKYESLLSCSLEECPRIRQVVVTVFTLINLVLYVIDSVYTHRLQKRLGDGTDE